ncbi:MAG TPA: aldolase/citrate lyase family protein [Euzebyales bacterium]
MTGETHERWARSALVVSADVQAHLQHAGRSPADAVVLDLADVDAPGKDIARQAVVDTLAASDLGGRLVSVRINPIDTMWAYRDVIDVVERIGDFVDRIAVPDVGGPVDVQFVELLLRMIEERIDLGHTIMLEAEVASPAGLSLLSEITLASDRLETLVLDEVGLTEALDITPRTGALSAAVRPQVAVAAHATGLQPVVRVDATEDGAYRTAITAARTLGYGGARCARPRQVEIANDVFSVVDAG